MRRIIGAITGAIRGYRGGHARRRPVRRHHGSAGGGGLIGRVLRRVLR